MLVWSGVDLALRPIAARPREHLRVGRGGALAFVIGILGGAAGVILGTLRMPALIRSVGLDVRRAAGTNLVVGFLLGAAGFATYAAGTGVDWGVLAVGLAGAIPGGWLGARATGKLPENVLRLALGAVLVLVGLAFAVQAMREGSAYATAGQRPRSHSFRSVAERGSCDVEALRVVAAPLAEDVPGLSGLDALGDDREAEGVADLDQPAHQSGIRRAAPEAVHERCVDLQLVEGEHPQRCERGGASTVVEREPYAQARKAAERFLVELGARAGSRGDHLEREKLPAGP